MSTSTAYSQSGGTVSQSNKFYISTADDESAVYVTGGGTLNLNNLTIKKTGDTSNRDNSNFYGLNAAVLADEASTITIAGGTVYTDGSGTNGVFATGDGTMVTLKNVVVDCNGEVAHGLDATVAGTLVAANCTVTTTGSHAAAIATDRGGGYVTFTGGKAITHGLVSPGLYSTGEITVSDATIVAKVAECAVIEGFNSIVVTDSSLTGSTCGAQIYQSMSGDASVGTGQFTMTGGSLTVTDGPAFYVTNTDAVIILKDVTLTVGDGTILKASANSTWGTSGSNGGIVTFTADAQDLEGDITVDDISTADITLQNGSSLKGVINAGNTAKSVTLTMDTASTWSLIADSYLSTFTDSNTEFTNIDDNGFNIYYDSLTGVDTGEYALPGGGTLLPKAAV